MHRYQQSNIQLAILISGITHMKLYLKLLMFTFIIADACANVNQIFVKPMRHEREFDSYKIEKHRKAA